MDLPKYQAFYKPILLFLQDGKAHSTKEIKQYTQKYFSLKEEDIIEKLASGEIGRASCRERVSSPV